MVKYLLNEEDMPRFWYNIVANLPFELPPPIHPATGQPLRPEDLAPLLPAALIEQELATERDIEIPEEVREAYRL